MKTRFRIQPLPVLLGIMIAAMSAPAIWADDRGKIDTRRSGDIVRLANELEDAADGLLDKVKEVRGASKKLRDELQDFENLADHYRNDVEKYGPYSDRAMDRFARVRNRWPVTRSLFHDLKYSQSADKYYKQTDELVARLDREYKSRGGYDGRGSYDRGPSYGNGRGNGYGRGNPVGNSEDRRRAIVAARDFYNATHTLQQYALADLRGGSTYDRKMAERGLPAIRDLRNAAYEYMRAVNQGSIRPDREKRLRDITLERLERAMSWTRHYGPRTQRQMDNVISHARRIDRWRNLRLDREPYRSNSGVRLFDTATGW